MFHEEVHVNELLRLPFPFPDQQPDPRRAQQIINKVAKIVTDASTQSETNFLDRSNQIQSASKKITPLIREYFDISASEELLIADTLAVLVPSIQPSHSRMPVPTVAPATSGQRQSYIDRLCETINRWSKVSRDTLRGSSAASTKLGIGIAKLERGQKSKSFDNGGESDAQLLDVFNRLRNSIPKLSRTLDPTRELLVFDKDEIYIVKPIGFRHWTQTAALNDADEIAGAILMHSLRTRA